MCRPKRRLGIRKRFPKERVYEKQRDKREWQRPRRRQGIRERLPKERVDEKLRKVSERFSNFINKLFVYVS